MIREHVLTISSVLAFVALSGAAYAGPTITNKNYWPNEVGPSSRPAITQTVPDWYHARAMQRAAPPAPRGDRQGCRYLGGPKYPITC